MAKSIQRDKNGKVTHMSVDNELLPIEDANILLFQKIPEDVIKRFISKQTPKQLTKLITDLLNEERSLYNVRKELLGLNIESQQYEKIDRSTIQSSKYDENIEREGEHSDTCFICGKRTKSKQLVHYLTSGELVAYGGDDIKDSQGFFPIGSNCAKKLPKKFIF